MEDQKNGIREIDMQEVTNILKSGDFDEFIGVRENEVFEAKSNRPYNLDDDADKRHAIAELSSDVASFANQKGGFIICGLHTPSRPDTPRDVVASTSLVEETDFYEEGLINGILNTSIYPSLKVEVSWYPSSSEPTLGLGVIHIPEQNEEKMYFIVKVCESNGRKLRNFLGIPVRTDDGTNWLDAGEVYRLSKRKPSNLQVFHQSLSDQIQGLSSQIRDLEAGSQPEPGELLQTKIDEALSEQTSEIPLYILAAAPNERVRFDSFLNTGEGSPMHLLEKPPYTRYDGWNMLTMDQARIREASYWEVKNGDRKTIRLYRDGSLVAIAYADRSFLAYDNGSAEKLALYEFAITEYTYEFVELYRQMLQYMESVKNVMFRVGLVNTKLDNGEKLCLAVNPRGLLRVPEMKGAIAGNFYYDISVVLQENKYDSRYVAFSLIQETFIRFDLRPDTPAFSRKDEDGERYIDIGQFLKY